MPWRINRSPFQSYQFKDIELLARALTHRSAARNNNERMEFLGDSLVNLVIGEALFTLYPKASEGDLTRMRADLVRESTLADIAKELDLGSFINLGPGELKSGGSRRASILSDTFEALIAAVYLDSDFLACRKTILDLFDDRLTALGNGFPDKDPKTALQEKLQAHALTLPVYNLIDTSGDDHERVFTVECAAEDLNIRAQASGNSRRAAETDAAAQVLAQIHNLEPKQIKAK